MAPAPERAAMEVLVELALEAFEDVGHVPEPGFLERRAGETRRAMVERRWTCFTR